MKADDLPPEVVAKCVELLRNALSHSTKETPAVLVTAWLDAIEVIQTVRASATRDEMSAVLNELRVRAERELVATEGVRKQRSRWVDDLIGWVFRCGRVRSGDALGAIVETIVAEMLADKVPEAERISHAAFNLDEWERKQVLASEFVIDLDHPVADQTTADELIDDLSTQLDGLIERLNAPVGSSAAAHWRFVTPFVHITQRFTAYVIEVQLLRTLYHPE